MVEIKTKRLVLRPPNIEDAPRMQRILENFEVAKNLSRVAHPYPENGAKEYIEHIAGQNDDLYFTKFAIINGDGHYCGMTGYGRQGSSNPKPRASST